MFIEKNGLFNENLIIRIVLFFYKLLVREVLVNIDYYICFCWFSNYV